MPEWLVSVMTVLGSVGGSVAACSTIVKPFKDKVQEAKVEGAEEAQEENEKKNQKGWTASQQDDIDELAVGNMVSISSLLMTVNTLIEAGPAESREDYKRVRAVLMDYMQERGTRNKSHK